MPITNLAIQRRRLHELHELIIQKDLELFSIEHDGSYYYDRKTNAYHTFTIHGRQLTPAIVKRIQEAGFTVKEVKALNEYTLIIEVEKWPTNEERPIRIPKICRQR